MRKKKELMKDADAAIKFQHNPDARMMMDRCILEVLIDIRDSLQPQITMESKHEIDLTGFFDDKKDLGGDS